MRHRRAHHMLIKRDQAQLGSGIIQKDGSIQGFEHILLLLRKEASSPVHTHEL